MAFLEMSLEDRLALFGHAWNRLQRRRLSRLVGWAAVVALAASLVFTAAYAGWAARTEARLAVSEAERERLAERLADLGLELENKRRAVVSNSRVLDSQRKTLGMQAGLLRRREEELRVRSRELESLTEEVRKREEELEELRREITRLEEMVREKDGHLRSLEGMLEDIAREWDMDMGSAGPRLVILDRRYDHLRRAFEAGDHAKAVMLVEELRGSFSVHAG